MHKSEKRLRFRQDTFHFLSCRHFCTTVVYGTSKKKGLPQGSRILTFFLRVLRKGKKGVFHVFCEKYLFFRPSQLAAPSDFYKKGDIFCLFFIFRSKRGQKGVFFASKGVFWVFSLSELRAVRGGVNIFSQKKKEGFQTPRCFSEKTRFLTFKKQPKKVDLCVF